MPAKKGLTLDAVIAALRKANGNISLTARQLGVGRNAVQHYLRNYPTARDAADEAAAYITDIAEGHLVQAVVRGDLDQVRYWLENKARDRGYGRGVDPLLTMTADQLAALSDEELDALANKLDRVTRRR